MLRRHQPRGHDVLDPSGDGEEEVSAGRPDPAPRERQGALRRDHALQDARLTAP